MLRGVWAVQGQLKRRPSLSNLHEQRPTMDFSEVLEFCKCFGIVPELLDMVELQDLFALVNGDEECVGCGVRANTLCVLLSDVTPLV